MMCKYFLTFAVHTVDGINFPTFGSLIVSLSQSSENYSFGLSLRLRDLQLKHPTFRFLSQDGLNCSLEVPLCPLIEMVNSKQTQTIHKGNVLWDGSCSSCWPQVLLQASDLKLRDLLSSCTQNQCQTMPTQEFECNHLNQILGSVNCLMPGNSELICRGHALSCKAHPVREKSQAAGTHSVAVQVIQSRMALYKSAQDELIYQTLTMPCPVLPQTSCAALDIALWFLMQDRANSASSQWPACLLAISWRHRHIFVIPIYFLHLRPRSALNRASMYAEVRKPQTYVRLQYSLGQILPLSRLGASL